MATGIFPKILKAAIFSPVYKKDDPQKLDNYRPISTHPVFSKKIEKLIYKRMYSFLCSKMYFMRSSLDLDKITQPHTP